MKKVILLMIAFLCLTLTNCERLDKSEVGNTIITTSLDDHKVFKTGKHSSDYEQIVWFHFEKLWKKLEKKAKDKKTHSQDGLLAAAEQPQPEPLPIEILEEMDDDDALALLDDLTPASVDFIASYDISTTSLPTNGLGVFSAIIGDYLQAAVDMGIELEVTDSTTITYRVPSSISENDPFLLVMSSCLKSALGSLAVDFTKAGAVGYFAGGATRAAVKEAIMASLGTAAKTIASKIVIAWYTANVLGCLYDYYIAT